MIQRGFSEAYRRELDNIFFLTAQQKSFSDEAERQAYYQRWAGQYIGRYPEWVYTAREEEGILGYLLGCPDSREAVREIDFPGLEQFSQLFDAYPAHLHINVLPQAQGRSIGRKLIAAYCRDLRAEDIPGVHLITTTKAGNAGFYQAVGFETVMEVPENDMRLLFMGRSLAGEQ
ncbi:MAG: GNAT family N-acetyltransferase [Spirochaeta sp.]